MNPVTQKEDPKSSTPPVTSKTEDRKIDPKRTPPISTAGYPKKHKIAQNDSFWKLATKYYGRATPKLVEHIQKSNPSMDAKKMTLGKTLIIPAPPKEAPPKARAVVALEKAPAKPKSAKPRAPSTPKKYKVKKHDTLSELAKVFYGDPNKYHLIKQANESLHYQDLIAGSTIIIPPLR